MKSEQAPKGSGESRYPQRLYLVFILLALVSSLGLDYIAARKGRPAYLFSFPAPEKEVVEVPVSLSASVLRFLDESGISREVVQELEDETGGPLIQVHLGLEAYSKIEAGLEKVLRAKKASLEKQEKKTEEEVTFSWLVRGRDQEQLALQFSCPLPAPAPKEEAPPRRKENRVAIIIDDMGNSLETLQEICDLRRPLTISILPQSAYARESAQMAHDNGLEVMLHLPGESLNHQEGNDSTAGLVRSGMSDEEIRTLVEDSLAQVPYAIGVNNHMGSKITQEESLMRPILEILKEKDLFFLDSRTSSHSIAYDLANRMGLRSAYRNTFLDSSVGVEFSKQKMKELFRLAQKKGKAIGIGHPFPETLRALRENMALAEKYKVKLVLASEVILE
jgi:hypothetical protein